MIPVHNIYYMLAYAFQVLNENGYKDIETEQFDNVGELCAAILAKGVALQLKRGLGKEYMIVVRKLYADGNIAESSVEETANILKVSYEKGLLIHPDFEDRCTTKFIIAGKLKTGQFGFIVVEAENFVVKTQTFDTPISKIYGPADVSSKDCASILNSFAKSTKIESVPQYIEEVCRKTVQAVSEMSNYVSFESLFLIYSEY